MKPATEALTPPPAQTPPPRPVNTLTGSGAGLVKTVFDASPPSTLAARIAAERARSSLQAAVRSIAKAKADASVLQKLASEEDTARAIAEHEGVGAETISKFLKAAEPLLSAFTAS